MGKTQGGGGEGLGLIREVLEDQDHEMGEPKLDLTVEEEPQDDHDEDEEEARDILAEGGKRLTGGSKSSLCGSRGSLGMSRLEGGEESRRRAVGEL